VFKKAINYLEGEESLCLDVHNILKVDFEICRAFGKYSESPSKIQRTKEAIFGGFI